MINNIKKTNTTFLLKKSLFLMFFLFIIINFTYAQEKLELTTIEDYVKQISTNILNKSIPGRKQVVKNYCEFVLGHPFYSKIENNYIYYNASQSVFLYLLCNHVGNYASKFNKSLIKNIKKRKLEQFNLICKSRKDGIWQPVGCIPGCEKNNPRMLGCDFSMLLPKIIKSILNDISNIGLVLSYGIFDENKKIDNLTNDLAFKYFDFPLYNSKFTEYPKTKDKAKMFLKKIRKIIKKTEIIEFDKLMKLGRKKPSQECNKNILNYNFEKYNIYTCMFNDINIFDQKKPILRGIIDAMQNEVFWYQLFVDYYSHILKNNLNLIPFKLTEQPVKEMNKTLEEAEKIKTDSIIVHKALQTTIRSLTNVQATFWIHIGLSMYYEEAVKFRNALAKIYTPIHQLYYKLRNVQQEK